MAALTQEQLEQQKQQLKKQAQEVKEHELQEEDLGKASGGLKQGPRSIPFTY